MIEELHGKTALITGGGGGIGRATALALARQGARIASVDLDGDAAQETAKAIEANGGTSWASMLDVTDSAAVSAVIGEAECALGPIDRLVNIAGIYRLIDAENITDEDWRRMFSIHVDGTFFCCRAALPGMIARGSGAIVNTSSLHAIRGQAGAVHYSAAKGAIVGLTKALAREKAPSGIRVNAVAPGPIDTPLFRGAIPPGEADTLIAKRTSIIPMGRLGRVDEVAGVIAFLLSDAASYMTGQIVTIDGGEVMN